MTWAQRLKRVFSIDIEVCGRYGGSVKIMPKALAALAGQALRKVLDHLKEKGECPEGIRLPKSRAPPIGLFT